jgi:hypothetical protein
MQKEIKDIVKKMILEVLSEEEISEERISNRTALNLIKKRENFTGSHSFGEDIGNLGEMYVVFSYGIQHPLYLWSKLTNKWYVNKDDYFTDGKANKFTRKHKKVLKPTDNIKNRSKDWMVRTVNKFMEMHNIAALEHTSLEPGEK